MEADLIHYGVLGMKWGRRKGTITTSKGSKKISEMSDDELKVQINRKLLEKQYKDLTKREKGPGEKFVQDVLTKTGTQVVSSYLAKYITKGIDAIVDQLTKK